MLSRIAQDNNLIENGENIQLVINPENHQFDKSKYNFTNDSLAQISLLRIGDVNYNADSLYTYINRSSRQQNSREFLFNQYNAFKAEVLKNYEKAHLADKYPEYKYLKKEYHDGILLFSIMEDLVWNPASSDSVGILNYYEDNKASYVDSTTVEFAIFSSTSKVTIDSIQALFPDKESFISLSIAEKEALRRPNNDSTKVSLQLEFGEYKLTENKLLTNFGIPDKPELKQGKEQWYYLLPLRLAGEPRRLAQVRGRLIADYQEELEMAWITELSEKYQVNVDEKTLKLVYKKLEVQ
jgi:peptidyl-prolyl cis-trans isomerase SurA